MVSPQSPPRAGGERPIGRPAAERPRLQVGGRPTEKAGVKNGHTPMETCAGFLKFGTRHRVLMGTQLFQKNAASVRQ